MARALLLIALAIAAGCDDATSNTADLAAPDLAAGGCSRAPNCRDHAGDFECTDGDMVCGCHSGFAFCHSTDCPDVTQAEGVDGTPCTTPGLRCLYGFENGLVCVGPEDRWAFCGGVPICASNTTGALCCGPGGPCQGSPACMCGTDNHVHCADADGGI